MKRKSSFFFGGFQPVLFAVGMYLMALVFSIFICGAIFNALTHRNQPTGVPRDNAPKTEKASPAGPVSMNLKGQ